MAAEASSATLATQDAGSAPDGGSLEAAADGEAMASLPRFARCATFGFGDASAIAVSPDGSLVAIGSALDQVLVFRSSDGSLAHRLDSGASTRAVAFSDDGSLLAAAGPNGAVGIWATATWSLQRTVMHVEADGFPAVAVTFSPDSATLATAGATETRLWRVSDGGAVRTLATTAALVGAVAFSPRGDLIAAGENLFRVSDGSVVLSLGPPMSVNAVAFSSDGEFVASMSRSRTTVSEWRLSDLKLVAEGSEVGAVFFDIAFRPGSHDLVVSTGRLEFWRVTDPAAALPQPLGSFAITGVLGDHLRFSANGSILAVAHGSTIAVFNGASASLPTDAPRSTIASLVSAETLLAFSPDGTRLVTGEQPPSWQLSYLPPRPSSVLVWDVASQSLLYRIDQAVSAAFSPDGQSLLTGGVAPAAGVVLRSAADGTVVRSIGYQDVSQVLAVAFSPSGKEVAGAARDGTIVRWSAEDGHRIATLQPFTSASRLLYSPDGNQLVSLSPRGGEVLRATDGEALLLLQRVGPFGFSYSADGRLAATFPIWATPVNSLMLLSTSDWSVAADLHSTRTNYVVAMDPASGMVAATGLLQTDIVRADGSVAQSFPALDHADDVSLAFSRDGSRFASGAVVPGNDYGLAGIVRVYCR
jgi:WD40 repeat protein